ncbi:hypothetical protein PPERSA_01233 [Pseudocohnilembus persalinus]|uniref:BTB domain-containing protein n=1 Tax=Pseudocohnilembus persalinus TaxID=266149 RepID=A0A0V0R9Q6_PSEPJ|nr:hypothetical protein PPERSA_01233 [Pseudocohnilembus persalinus]|eukprot:KRX11034.1 hypothetical protein PPERSA_01233 [Pseudocohnilembus persalinus]
MQKTLLSKYSGYFSYLFDVGGESLNELTIDDSLDFQKRKLQQILSLFYGNRINISQEKLFQLDYYLKIAEFLQIQEIISQIKQHKITYASQITQQKINFLNNSLNSKNDTYFTQSNNTTLSEQLKYETDNKNDCSFSQSTIKGEYIHQNDNCIINKQNKLSDQIKANENNTNSALKSKKLKKSQTNCFLQSDIIDNAKDICKQNGLHYQQQQKVKKNQKTLINTTLDIKDQQQQKTLSQVSTTNSQASPIFQVTNLENISKSETYKNHLDIPYITAVMLKEMNIFFETYSQGANYIDYCKTCQKIFIKVVYLFLEDPYNRALGYDSNNYKNQKILRKIEFTDDQRIEKNFFSFVFRHLCWHGGTFMQVPISDLNKALLKLPNDDDVNVYRKKFGNINQCLNNHKNPFYTIEGSVVVKMRSSKVIKQLLESGIIVIEDYKIYKEAQKKANQHIKQTIINNQIDICKNCGNEYNPKLNYENCCPYYPKDYTTSSFNTVQLRDLYDPKGKQNHQPLYNINKLNQQQEAQKFQ